MHFPPATTLKIEQHIYILAGEKITVAVVIIMVLLLILVATKPFSVGKLKGEPTPTQGIRSGDEGLQVGPTSEEDKASRSSFVLSMHTWKPIRQGRARRYHFWF